MTLLILGVPFPLLVFIAVLAGASLGTLIGGIFGAFVAALLAIPTAGALQVLVKEVWQATAPDQPQNPRHLRLSQQTSTVTLSPGTDPHPTIQASDPN